VTEKVQYNTLAARIIDIPAYWESCKMRRVGVLRGNTKRCAA